MRRNWSKAGYVHLLSQRTRWAEARGRGCDTRSVCLPRCWAPSDPSPQLCASDVTPEQHGSFPGDKWGVFAYTTALLSFPMLGGREGGDPASSLSERQPRGPAVALLGTSEGIMQLCRGGFFMQPGEAASDNGSAFVCITQSGSWSSLQYRQPTVLCPVLLRWQAQGCT